MNKTLVVLAAGMGSRYGGLKQLDAVGPSGETIIEYSLFDAADAGFNHIVFIIRESFYEEFRDRIGGSAGPGMKVSYVFQDLSELPDGFAVPDGREKPWGTGHALYCARKVINNPFLIINGDDFYGRDAFAKAAAAMDEAGGGSFGGLVAYSLENTLSENGSVSRGICTVDERNRLKGVVETHGIQAVPVGSEVVSDSGPLARDARTSMNLWFFSPDIFDRVEGYFIDFLNARGQEVKSEFYLPAIANRLVEEGVLDISVLETDAKWYGVTFREDKALVSEALFQMAQLGTYPDKLREA